MLTAARTVHLSIVAGWIAKAVTTRLCLITAIDSHEIQRHSIQQAVDKLEPGEVLEIDADGLARAFPPGMVE